MLLSFLLSFGFIRTSARLMRSPRVPWWPGSVATSDGLHIHHLVWGIVLLLVSGFAAFATRLDGGWEAITAIGFGIGAGLTLDEFALWLRLRDVYWATEGRASLDAVVLATVFAIVVVLGVEPLTGEGSTVLTAVGVALLVLLSALTMLKGRYVLGIVSLHLPFAGLYALSRLAKPDSPWAHRRYRGRHEGKLERSRERFSPNRPAVRRWNEVLNLIGGAPSRK